jgi:hypothetical protein
MKTYQYINTPEILRIVQGFQLFLIDNGICDLNESKHKNLRSLMLDYFKKKEFQENYKQMAISIIKKLQLTPSNYMLQKTPTPRIFRPGDHGTSFHSDYWYGHGEKTITIWTPLSELESGNSFSIIPENQLNEEMTKSLNNTFGVASQSQEKILLDLSDAVLPELGQSVAFASKTLHGSPQNTTNKIRISFDCRIAVIDDKTSTKDPETYFQWSNDSFIEMPNKFFGKNYLKYICGGHTKSTLAQHLIIESVVKEYSISISGQEAEVERFGQPIFRAYLANLASTKNIDGLIIASKSILDNESIRAAERDQKIRVYCALENEFI